MSLSGFIFMINKQEDVYNMAEMSKSSIGDKTAAFRSSLLEGEMESGTRSKLTDETMEKEEEGEGMSKSFGSDEIKEYNSPPRGERLKSVVTNEPSGGQEIKKIMLAVNLISQSKRSKMMKALRALQGIVSVDFGNEEGIVTVIGDVDPRTVVICASKIADTEILSVGPASETLAEQETDVEPGNKSGKEDKPGYESDEPGNKSGKEDKPGYESEKDDKADTGHSKDDKQACSVM
ncbi:hypothetical protein Hanom_Chr07g00581171 [Helianthus anomalus]